MRLLFILGLFLSASLLFLVQPMLAKMMLPRFGGSPAVWSTSILFFQVLLLAGYAYAHLSVRFLDLRRQRIVQLALVAAGLVSLPVTIPASAGAVGGSGEVGSLLWGLAAAVGLPFVALSSNAPVLQRWFSASDDPLASDPYFLYRASNLGSMVALLAYPAIIEPGLALRAQSALWSGGYVLLLVLLGAMALVSAKGGSRAQAEVAGHATGERIGWRTRAMWIALAAVPSSLMLGVTTYWTTNLTPMPLLWVLPLGIYLWTYIVAFGPRPVVGPALLGRLFAFVALPLALVITLESDRPVWLLVPIHLLAFGLAALMCHTRLAQSRPPVAHLTEFYFWIALGGAVGGAFNALIAPQVFQLVIEYPLALVAAALLRPISDEARFKVWDVVYACLVAGCAAGTVWYARRTGMEFGPARTFLTIGIPIILAFFALDRPIRFGLSLGGFFIVTTLLRTSAYGKPLYIERSFFGVHRVQEVADGAMIELVHGNTLHGKQPTDPVRRREPLSYYSRKGPLGDVFAAVIEPKANARVAAVGLGAGAIAAYGRPGDEIRFFEIDAVVERIATNPRWFTYLSDSAAQISVILGDARLTLAHQPDRIYDLMILDAFSSDAIPVHLLTRDAVREYLRKLRPGGVLAFHTSNRYLQLKPVLADVAGSLGLVAWYRDDGYVDDEDYRQGRQASKWLVMARDDADLGPIPQNADWERVPPREGRRVWTDDYSNVIGALRIFASDD